jgi:hypothetical protein
MSRMLAAVALALTSLVTAGCNPCPDGMKETKDGGKGYADIGLPPGALACLAEPADDLGPHVIFPKTSEAEAKTKLEAHLASKGWKPLPIPADVQKEQAQNVLNGLRAGTHVIFGKDGSAERRYGELTTNNQGDANINLYANDCVPTPSGSVIDECK